MGVRRPIAIAALRLSMGRGTTAAEVDAVVDALAAAARSSRALGVSAARTP
jgi:cysteine sulfinate desulfinase/cysteine desulfurase-like protein